MAVVAPDLRPRGPVELYDSAIHLCIRGKTPLVILSMVGMVFPAASGMILADRINRQQSFVSATAIFVMCLMIRSLFAGAASLCSEAVLEGRNISIWQGFAQALQRAPSLMSASGMIVFFSWVINPFILFVGLLLWSPLYAAHSLVVRGEAGAFSVGRVCRKRIGLGTSYIIRMLHWLSFGIVMVNIHGGIWFGMFLARSFFAVDIAYLQNFCSHANLIYVLFLVSLTAILLEPIKNALGVLLLVDARIRKEGFDLLASIEQLTANKKVKGLALGMILVGVFPLHALAGNDDRTAEKMQRLAEKLILPMAGNNKEHHTIQKTIRNAKQYRGERKEALGRYIAQFAKEYESEETDESRMVLALQLKMALEEMEQLNRGDGFCPDCFAPKEAASQILARPEFENTSKKLNGNQNEEKTNYFVQLWEKIRKWLEEKKDNSAKQKRQYRMTGLNANISQLLIYVIIGLVLVIAIWFLIRFKRNQISTTLVSAKENGLPANEESESALSQTPRGWSQQASGLAMGGDYRGAVRALYLAVLCELHRQGCIEYDSTRSNWEYVKNFQGEDSKGIILQTLTRRFDFIWYGRLGANQRGYSEVLEQARLILEHKAKSDA